MSATKTGKRNTLGIISSLAFFFGSMLFLPQFGQYAIIGVWLFMGGSGLMFIDTLKRQPAEL
ncbi:YrhK family protein [Aestuariibacter halophilus]|uniref:YrhK family protein n=1 Tax=Fluctibacter halophilus TaxID=226011 RepID=A0ABS8GAH6_9ALTE|nr:YrhK family protein [Aestuariibacter halophilus]MCC2616231.1 YrhK family protein [Aestuariibacter halophilus]